MDFARTLTVDANNPVLGDLRCDAIGNLVWTNDENGESVAQRIAIRFAFWRGEYFADTRQGVPYFIENDRGLLGTPFDETTFSAVLRGVLLTTPGVSSVLSWTVTFADGTAEAVFVAQLASGEVLNSQDFGPFIVEDLPL